MKDKIGTYKRKVKKYKLEFESMKWGFSFIKEIRANYSQKDRGCEGKGSRDHACQTAGILVIHGKRGRISGVILDQEIYGIVWI